MSKQTPEATDDGSQGLFFHKLFMSRRPQCHNVCRLIELTIKLKRETLNFTGKDNLDGDTPNKLIQ